MNAMKKLLRLTMMFFVSGLVVGTAASSTAVRANALPHPCQYDTCKKFLWIDWCSRETSAATYCSHDVPNVDCVTTPCGHVDGPDDEHPH